MENVVFVQEPGIFAPPGLLPHPQQSHNQVAQPGLSQHHHKVSPPAPLTNSTRTPVITSHHNPPIPLASCTVSRYSSSNSVSVGTTSPPAGCSVNSSSDSWQRGKAPKPLDSTSVDPSPKSQVDALLQGSCQSPQQDFMKPPKQNMSYYAQAKPPQPPQFSSSALFSSGHQDSVITSRGSTPLPCSPSYTPASSTKLSHQLSSSPQVFSAPRAPPPVSQSIGDVLDKLDAELQGHMQAEERRRKEREERKLKEERQKREWEMRKKLEEERRRREQEEERKRREIEKQEEEQRLRQEQERRRKQEEERRRREIEKQEEQRLKREQEKQRKLEEERRRREMERLEERKRRERQEEERKKIEWEKEQEKKRKEWERQQEERKRREAERQERRRREMEREEEKKQMELEERRKEKLLGAKGKEQTAIENLERLLSGSSPQMVPPLPPLSSVSAPPSGPPASTSQASPPYPWLSRGGQPNQTPGASAERLRPPPLTPQTEYAREKQRQREMWSSAGGATFIPPSTHNTSGMNQPTYPNKPPAMQAAPNQAKDSGRDRDSPQHPLPTLALREPPKLYHAMSRENLQPPPLSFTPIGGLHSKPTEGATETASSDSNSAQFEDESPELTTMLPEGLANIMAMLDESIKKEEEMYNSEKSGSPGLLHSCPPAVDPVKSYLCAPDLIPATKQQPNQEDLGSNSSPPVLSRQGSLASPCSRTSSLEEDEDYPKARPAVETRMGVGNTNYRHSDLAKLYGLPEQTKSEADEESEEDSETASCSPPPQRPHLHQTGVNSMFKSLATVLESQKYAYRGGPFGRPPPSALVGVKYSSSLSLGPDICCQQQGSSPTSDSTSPPFSPAARPQKCSPRSLQEDKKRKMEDSDVWTDEGETDERTNPIKRLSIPAVKPVKAVKEECELTTISESSLKELGKSCEVMLCRQSLDKLESRARMEDRHKPEKVKEHKEKKRRHGHSSSRKHKDKKDKKKHREKRDDLSSSSSSSSSSRSSSSHKRHKDGRSHREKKDRRILGDLNHQRRESEKNGSFYEAEKKKRRDAPGASSAGEGDRADWTSSSGERPAKLKNDGSSVPSLGSTDLLKLKALSDGPPKELKIRLIKVESGDRETFIASEVDEKRIPLKDISIKNTASEIIRSCK